MTATERARRSDALYYSNGPKRELCDKVAFLESDLEDAKAENAKMHEEIEAAKHDLSIFSGRIVELDAENAKLREENERFIIKLNAEHIARQNVEADNAKLRELAEDMWHLMDGSGVTTGAWGRCVQILDRMCELGIEVDENDGTGR